MQKDDEKRLHDLLAKWEQAAAAGTFFSAEELCPEGDTHFRAELTEAIDCLKQFCAYETPVQTSAQQASDFHCDQYQGIEEIDEGGQGRVIRARDLRLGRDVAIKMVKENWLTSANRRFKQEARITGSLEHPGVIPIYGFGHDKQGQPYYAMRYVKQERTLKEVIDQTRAMPTGPEKTVAFQNLLRTFLAMCRTVEFAHSREIIHRDIKPDNVLVGDFGEVFVTDWGIAKSLAAPTAASDAENAAAGPAIGQTAGTLGTASYMSPEQARDPANAGKHSDVYSLGATLYHLLTGSAPRTAVDTQLAKPRSIDPAIPPALEAVCSKAMNRDPKDRYPSASDLALEIERWLADEPVEAWPEPALLRTRRWMNRHRTAVTAGAVLLLMGTMTLAITTVLLAQWNQDNQDFIGQLGQESDKRDKLIEDLKQADTENATLIANLGKKNKDLGDALYLNQFLAAHAAWEQMDVGRAEAILDKCDTARRSIEWHYLKGQCLANHQTAIPYEGDVRQFSISNDGKLLACIDNQKQLSFVDAFTGKKLSPPKSDDFRIERGAFRPDGKQFAALGTSIRPGLLGSDYLFVMDPATGRTSNIISLDTRPSGALDVIYQANEIVVLLTRTAFKPKQDGPSIDSIFHLSLVRFDSSTGKNLGETRLDASAPIHPEGLLSPNGEVLAYWNNISRSIHLRHVSFKRELELKLDSGPLGAIDFSRDGRFIAATGQDGRILVGSPFRGEELIKLQGHKQPVLALAFSPDGKLLASAGADRRIKIWNTATGRELLTLGTNDDFARRYASLAFLPDGRLAYSGMDKRIATWSVTPFAADVIADIPCVYSLGFSQDGKALYSGHLGKDPFDLRSIRVNSLEKTGKSELFPSVAPYFKLSPNRDRLVAAARNAVEIWNVLDRRRVQSISDVGEPMAFSPDGNHIAALHRPGRLPSKMPPNAEKDKVSSESNPIHILDARSGQILQRLAPKSDVINLAWYPTKAQLLTYSRNSAVTTWDSVTGAEIHSFNTGQIFETRVIGTPLMALSSLDGRILATTGNEWRPSLRVWNVETGKLLWEQQTLTKQPTAMIFTPDGRRLVLASEDRTIKIWDVASAQELLTTPPLEGIPYVLAFTPDGRRLAAGCEISSTRGQILIWPRATTH